MDAPRGERVLLQESGCVPEPVGKTPSMSCLALTTQQRIGVILLDWGIVVDMATRSS